MKTLTLQAIDVSYGDNSKDGLEGPTAHISVYTGGNFNVVNLEVYASDITSYFDGVDVLVDEHISLPGNNIQEALETGKKILRDAGIIVN